MHRLWSPALMAVLGLGLVGCGDDGGAVPDAGAIDASSPDAFSLTCSPPGHTRLDPANLGQVVAWEPVSGLDLTASGIDGVLEFAGAEHLQPTPYGVDAYRIRYTTQDRGQQVEATALVVLPVVASAETFPTVLRQHPFSGLHDGCAPSRGNLMYAFMAGVLTASRGFVVISPDYLGMNGFGDASAGPHPLGRPEPAALASLDALRAGKAFLADAPDPDMVATGTDEVVIWGMSQGGFHTLWSLRYLASYGSELDIRAAVASEPIGMSRPGGGLLAEAIPFRMLQVAATLYTSHLWHGGTEPITEVLTDEAASSLPDLFASQCGPPAMEGLTSPEQIFRADFLAAVAAEQTPAPWGCYLASSIVLDSELPPSDVPLLVVTSELDESLSIVRQRAGAAELCDGGRELQYLECAGADHVAGTFESFAYQEAWVRARLAGTPVPAAELCDIAAPVDCVALGAAASP